MGGQLEAFNLCGREFVQQRVSARLPVHHVIMNLPNSAIDFLGAPPLSPACSWPTTIVIITRPSLAMVRKEGVLMGACGGRCGGWCQMCSPVGASRTSPSRLCCTSTASLRQKTRSMTPSR